MQTTEIYEKLNGVFRSVFADDTIVVTPQTTADDVDDWDSLAHVRLILTTERTFGVKFSAYEVNQLRNVGQLVELVQAKLARQ
jgi:acyl carrier protein